MFILKIAGTLNMSFSLMKRDSILHTPLMKLIKTQFKELIYL